MILVIEILRKYASILQIKTKLCYYSYGIVRFAPASEWLR